MSSFALGESALSPVFCKECCPAPDTFITEAGLRRIDDCVGWCGAAGLNLLQNLHMVFGYTFDPLDADANREIFFHDAEPQERFGIGRALWNYKEKDFGLVDAHCDGVRDALVRLL